MTRKTITSAVAGLAAAITFAGPALSADVLDPLVTPADLSELRDGADPLILDIRGDAYAEGHIPGAVSAPYGLFRGPAENPGRVPGEAELTETLRGLGVSADRPVVVVHRGRDETDFGAAARVYWTLKSSGVADLGILNGGMTAWQEAGLAVSDAAATPEPSQIEVSFSHDWMATAEEVQAVIEGGDDTLLLDARPESFWKGEDSHPAAARPGTIPQSEYFTHSGWFNSGPAIVDADAARRLAEEEGLTDADSIISFCNTGHWAATNWFALSELAGLEDVRLYPESMVGWSNAGYEMANVPGLIENLIDQVTE
jgi:thiosulfate/3-mercaptopyruvate sulfurtransferase